mmetsp:Transcript_10425/g.21000  ORF Transcript_10425/g.21000 Transcript_10425/m.21000 type:complete len:277 (+) Transcript_10425:2944-3774(+)
MISLGCGGGSSGRFLDYVRPNSSRGRLLDTARHILLLVITAIATVEGTVTVDASGCVRHVTLPRVKDARDARHDRFLVVVDAAGLGNNLLGHDGGAAKGGGGRVRPGSVVVAVAVAGVGGRRRIRILLQLQELMVEVVMLKGLVILLLLLLMVILLLLLLPICIILSATRWAVGGRVDRYTIKVQSPRDDCSHNTQGQHQNCHCRAQPDTSTKGTLTSTTTATRSGSAFTTAYARLMTLDVNDARSLKLTMQTFTAGHTADYTRSCTSELHFVLHR